MHLLFENIVGEQLLRNICWTLAHSIWQGMVAAIIAYFIIVATKTASASFRYNLLLANLLLFFAAVITTFLIQEGSGSGASSSVQVMSGHPSFIEQFPSQGIGGGVISYISQFLNANSRIIVLMWTILTAFRLAQLFIGYWGMNRIKGTQVTSADECWKERLAQLVSSLRITRKVQLLRSGLVKTPMVISCVKPVILIPASFFTLLPRDEIEAILLHELSHIKRNDFLVNLFQNFIETLFCFNPFIFWISGLIREERENCCDDLAVSRMKNKTSLIKAMVSCREFNLEKSPGFVLAFGKRKEHLLNRAKRILQMKPRSFHTSEKRALVFCIPFAVILAFFMLQAFQVGKISQPLAGLGPLAGPAVVNQDSAVSPMAPVTGLKGKLSGLKSGISGHSDQKPGAVHSANYYGNGYRIVVQDSAIVKVYYHKTLLDSDGVKEHQREIDAIYRSRK